MLIFEGEGVVVSDEIVCKENSKKQARVYVSLWPKQGTHAVALEMDPVTYKTLYELRVGGTIPSPFHDKVFHFKRGSVVFEGEMVTPPTGLAVVDLKVIGRIRAMSEGTQYEQKALDYIVDAEGDTLRLVQVAEALAGALAAAGSEQTAVSPS